MSECLFCQIRDGAIPSKKVYEDDRALAFRDINPQAPTHVLIIPRKHLASLDAMGAEDEALVGHLHLVAAELARREGVAQTGYRVVFNTGPAAGQTVFHLHLHLVGGRSLSWPPGWARAARAQDGRKGWPPWARSGCRGMRPVHTRSAEPLPSALALAALLWVGAAQARPEEPQPPPATEVPREDLRQELDALRAALTAALARLRPRVEPTERALAEEVNASGRPTCALRLLSKRARIRIDGR